MEISEKDIEKLKMYLMKRRKSLENALCNPLNANLNKFITNQILEVIELEEILNNAK